MTAPAPGQDPGNKEKIKSSEIMRKVNEICSMASSPTTTKLIYVNNVLKGQATGIRPVYSANHEQQQGSFRTRPIWQLN